MLIRNNQGKVQTNNIIKSTKQVFHMKVIDLLYLNKFILAHKLLKNALNYNYSRRTTDLLCDIFVNSTTVI